VVVVGGGVITVNSPLSS